MLERGRCINTIPIGGTEADPDTKATGAEAAVLGYTEAPNGEATDIDELLTEIELENRGANLQAAWPGEKPDLSVLLSLTADATEGETARI